MNKQEVIEEIKTCKSEYDSNSRDVWCYEKGFEDARSSALNSINKLDEPEKPVVPQFVADWYVDHEAGFELHLSYLCINAQRYPERVDRKVLNWYNNLENEPIQTLVKMKLYGYEVEKEKLYTVKFVNEDFGKIYIGIFKRANKIGLSTLPMNDKYSKCYFTESELKELKFWDNPAFEIEEVKK